ncbi:MAG: hypothetical protein L0H79_01325 [Intrasporangium sp.]|nr:hypothetical protein [Intrasporangium sp.]
MAASAVIGLHDEKFGERVHAVVVRAPGAEVTEAELIASGASSPGTRPHAASSAGTLCR